MGAWEADLTDFWTACTNDDNCDASDTYTNYDG